MGKLLFCVAGAIGVGLAGHSQAATVDDTLATVTVTATRIEHAAFDVPASVDVRPIRRDTLGINLSESLAGIAGVVARDRQNYAQDTQISIRGFGARATFGIRGVRLYVDGIPATQPDGQGQVSHFNLASASQVQVLRGPFSALYGNSSGGVIALQTADGAGAPGISGGAAFSNFATRRYDIGSDGAMDARAGELNYRIGYTHFKTDGSRGHSAAQRDSLQGKLVWHVDAATLTLLANYFDAPDAQDPLGLTLAQYTANPTQSAPTSLQFDTRKSARQSQFGAIYDFDSTGTGKWRLLAYSGRRAIQQYLAVPIAAQSDARSSGGVVDLQTRFDGAELRWSHELQLINRPLTVVAGLTVDSLTQQRRGYENFIGTTLGVVGALRRDETNTVRGIDQYLQVEWSLAARWLLLVGARHSAIRFSSADRYVRTGIPGNPDDSGSTDYGATTPVLNLLWRASSAVHVYASYGQGFETPTLVELAYRSNGAAGLNFDLRAARTRSVELGAKLQLNPHFNAQVAFFRATTRNELVVVRNSGGRSAFANATRTQRSGAELALAATLPRAWQWQLSYTALQAEVVDAYRTCITTPCLTPTTLIAAGSRLPGVPASSVYQQLQWGRATGWHASLEARHVSAVYANDLNDTRAAAYNTVDIGAGYAAAGDAGRWSVYARVENLFDARYSGSLIVNEANGRYFEPAPGRTVLAGFNLRCCGTGS
jgi:iron complex outermembrane receptor protein